MATRDRSEGFIDGSIDRLIADTKDIEGVVASQLVSIFRRYEGRSLTLPEKSRLTNEIERAVRDIIANTSFSESVDVYLKDWDRVLEFTQLTQRELNDIRVTKQLLNPVQRAYVNLAKDTFLKDGLDEGFVKPVKTILNRSLVQGITVTEAREIIDKAVISDEQNLGVWSRYVTQIATDTVKQFEGGMNAEIKREFEMNAYAYVGDIIQTTRPQCRRWVQMGTITDEQLPEEVAWAQTNGSGYDDVLQVNVDNFAEVRGGYNCRHTADPVFA